MFNELSNAGGGRSYSQSREASRRNLTARGKLQLLTSLTNLKMSKLCISFLALVLLLSGCGKKNAGPPQMPPRPVTVAKAETRDVPIYLDEVGNCAAYETVTIQPQVSGPITAIHFTDGQEVKKEDMLF